MKQLRYLATAALVVLTGLISSDACAQRVRGVGRGITFKPSLPRVRAVTSTSSATSLSRNYSPPPSRQAASSGSTSTTRTRMTHIGTNSATISIKPTAPSTKPPTSGRRTNQQRSTKAILSRRRSRQSSNTSSTLTVRAPRKASAKNANITGTATVGNTVYSSKYSHLVDTSRPRDGGRFTRATRRKIQVENASYNGWQMRSDKSGKPISGREAQVDHMSPKSKGGPNSVGNAQMLSGAENRAKGAKQAATIKASMTKPTIGRNSGATTRAPTRPVR